MPLAIGMSKDFGGKPISLPVDVYYGLNEQLTLGLTHSYGVVQPILPYRPGLGICLSSEDDGCPKVYNNIGFDAIFQFMPGVIQLAAHGGLDICSIVRPDAGYAAAGRAVPGAAGHQHRHHGRPAAVHRPHQAGRIYNNKDVLWLPLAVQFWVNEMIRVSARTDLGGPLDGFSDSYFGARWACSPASASPT